MFSLANLAYSYSHTPSRVEHVRTSIRKLPRSSEVVAFPPQEERAFREVAVFSSGSRGRVVDLGGATEGGEVLGEDVPGGLRAVHGDLAPVPRRAQGVHRLPAGQLQQASPRPSPTLSDSLRPSLTFSPRSLQTFLLFLSDFLGRLRPSTTSIQKTPNALGVEESSSPRRALHF